MTSPHPRGAHHRLSFVLRNREEPEPAFAYVGANSADGLRRALEGLWETVSGWHLGVQAARTVRELCQPDSPEHALDAIARALAEPRHPGRAYRALLDGRAVYLLTITSSNPAALSADVRRDFAAFAARFRRAYEQSLVHAATAGEESDTCFPGELSGFEETSS